MQAGDASTREGRGRRVLVAMSGGVDSSVAAAVLAERGYEVIGCFMRLGSPGEALEGEADGGEAGGGAANGGQGGGPGGPKPYDSAGVACDPKAIKIGHQGCCSVGDAADARLVAAHLGVPLYVCNFKQDFGRIIDYFVDEYASGRTPNPCVRCNDWLKFGKLHDYARQLGCDFVASGHYARVTERTGAGGTEGGAAGWELRRGRHTEKDQSYVLFGVPRAQLAHTLLPIGEFESKEEVRALARRLGLPTFDKPDSQEICFVPDNDYAGLVERRRPELSGAVGRVVDESGTVLGTHGGQHRFTIGQRRGVGVAMGTPVFVVEKDAGSNTVVVGPRESLAKTRVWAAEANWLCEPVGLGGERGEGAGASFRVLARYRSNGEPVAAWARVLPDLDVPGDGGGERVPTPSGRTGAFEVVFEAAQHGVAAGQAVVLYDAADPGRVLGGGWIARAW